VGANALLSAPTAADSFDDISANIETAGGRSGEPYNVLYSEHRTHADAETPDL